MTNTYSGITKVGDKWRVQIFRKGKNFYLGQFDTDTTAAHIADDSNLITEAWAGRKPRLNFPDTKRPNEGALFSEQKEMLAYLRLYHPEDERTFIKSSDAGAYVPDVAIERMELMKRRLSDIAEQSLETLDMARLSMIRLSGELADMKKSNDWLKEKVAQLEVELRGARHVQEAAKSPSFMRLVVGPGHPDYEAQEQRKVDAAARQAQLGKTIPFPLDQIVEMNVGREAMGEPLIGPDGFEIKPEVVQTSSSNESTLGTPPVAV